MRKPPKTARSFGTITSNEGARESSSPVPIADLAKYTQGVPMTTVREPYEQGIENETPPVGVGQSSTREHGEEAVEIVARAIDGLDWFEEHGGTDPSHTEIAAASVTALSSAGLLATEQEWGVRRDDSTLAIAYGSKENASMAADSVGWPRVSRGVTAWREA